MTNIVVAPGQGSQSEGFLKPFIEEVQGFRELLKEYSSVVELDLISLGTDGSEDQIKDTAIAQPLIVAASLACYRTLPKIDVSGVAGHSVGEFTAAAISEVLSDAQALQLVSVRASAMAAAASEVETSMAAVICDDQQAVEKALSEHGLYGANYNGSNQVVAAGLKKNIQALVAAPPERARVIELKVAGAFHTSYMKRAQDTLSDHAKTMSAKDPVIKLWSNQNGQLVQNGQEFLELLVHQVSNPVRWDRVMEQFVGLEAQVIELAPAGALSGLVKRAVQDCRTVPLRSPQDFEKVAE